MSFVNGAVLSAEDNICQLFDGACIGLKAVDAVRVDSFKGIKYTVLCFFIRDAVGILHDHGIATIGLEYGIRETTAH